MEMIYMADKEIKVGTVLPVKYAPEEDSNLFEYVQRLCEIYGEDVVAQLEIKLVGVSNSPVKKMVTERLFRRY